MQRWFCAIILFAFSASVGLAQPRAYFTEPSLSPDRKEIAFVSGGDIWTVPATGGVASLLVSHTANEARPLYSPDGRYLAFISSRTGNGDIYLLTLATGDLKRLTFDDGLDQLDGWSRDGRWIYFSSTSRDIGGLNDLYRVGVNGGTPMMVSADRYTNEFFCAPSPDGKTLAFSARGIASGQWWRKGHSHIDESEIWLLRSFEDGAGTYERVTAAGGAKEMWPMWSDDGGKLFYVSDRTDPGNKNGEQNIWTATPGRSDARRLSNFTDGRVLWPSVSYDGREIVFEHNFAIWKLDTESGKASEVAITRRGASAGPGVERQRITDQISELQLSPDGKKVAFVVRGEVFAASATDGGDAARVSNSTAEEYQVAWSPDSRRLVYVSDRDGVPHLFLYDFSTNAETQLTRDAADDSTPRFSPDGKLLAFIRGAKELRVMDVAAKTERVVKTASFERPPIISDRPFAWSPDGKWLAYVPVGENQFKNVNVVSVDGGSSGPASYLANVFSNSVSWSPDGTYVLFDSGQRTESKQLARIDLVPRTPRFREDQFRDLFREETPRNRPEQRPAETPAPSPAPSPSPADDGVVIDLRNNSGGFVNVYAIDVLARRGYLTMTLRGLSGTPARTVLGQRALNRPTILVTNQHSLSDAEDFTEGYRTLQLGQVVGEPTAGWIIYTWNQSLIDGTNFRLPRMKITANDGTNMERNPRPVDIEVTRPIGETLTDRDSQLDVAVRELLKQLGAPRSTSPR